MLSNGKQNKKTLLNKNNKNDLITNDLGNSDPIQDHKGIKYDSR